MRGDANAVSPRFAWRLPFVRHLPKKAGPVLDKVLSWFDRNATT
jgi:hypothetical protein